MGNKKWTERDIYHALKYLEDNLDAYTKGVKSKFYSNAAEYLDKEGSKKTAQQVKTKFIELESTYKSYKTKLTKSGFGLKETDPDSIRGKMLYYILRGSLVIMIYMTRNAQAKMSVFL